MDAYSENASTSKLPLLLAWIAILAITALVAVLQHAPPGPEAGPVPESRGLWLVEIQGRYLVGMGEFAPDARPEAAKLIDYLQGGPVGQRLRAAVLAGEILGPAAGLEALERLESAAGAAGVELTETQRDGIASLRRFYRSGEQGGDLELEAGEAQRLVDSLGWFGKLALAPRDGGDPVARAEALRPASVAFVSVVLAVIGAGLLALVGLVLLPASLPWILRGRLSAEIAARSVHGRIYAETFAVWLGAYVLLSALGEAVGGDGPAAYIPAPLVSLLALAWPRLRGVPWREARRDLGLSFGPNPLLDVGAGLVSYVICLPLLAAGLACAVVLALVTGNGEAPPPAADDFSALTEAPHPVVEMLVGADRSELWLVLLLAVLVAPLVEEVFFRGVLYRHLREASRGLGAAASVALSALGSGLLFAAVHPQGWIGVPVVTAMGLGFALAREWRGSLTAAVVAHGLNNGAVLTLLALACVG
jgi:membrane protease YdiL (CAAX protease family)